ncbi:MAG: CbiX/SirB N-terminal domain-containing protein [Chloroflexota bacterium]
MKRAAIVLGPGGHNTPGNRRLRRLAAELQGRCPDTAVVAAYMAAGQWGADRSLGEAVEQLVAQGVDEVSIVPFLLEWPYPEHFDVPDLLGELAEAHPGVRFHLGRTLGSGPDVAALLVERLQAAWTLPDAATATVRDVSEVAAQTPVTTATLKPGEAPSLPAHRQHVLLCAGRRCAEVGSAEGFRALTAVLAERGLDTGPERVKVTRTKCLSPCAGAPVACLYPGGAFFYHLEAATMPAFVDDVLVAGGTLEGHTFQPGD